MKRNEEWQGSPLDVAQKGGHDMNRHRQRVIGLIMIGILTAGALVGGGWWLGQRSQTQSAASGVTTAPSASPPATDTTTPATPTSPANAGTWQRLPAAPIPGGPYAGVWTGTELLLHAPYFDYRNGSYIGRSVGAAYNPATHTWRNLPPAPGPVESIEGGYRAVWTGRELLGWGMGLDAAYNPASNRWRRLPAMDTGRIGHTAVCTGRQLLVWGGRTRDAGSWTAPAHGLVYDRAGDAWSPLPTSPLRGRAGHVAVWTGSQMLVWGGTPARASDPQEPFADGATYTPYPL